MNTHIKSYVASAFWRKFPTARWKYWQYHVTRCVTWSPILWGMGRGEGWGGGGVVNPDWAWGPVLPCTCCKGAHSFASGQILAGCLLPCTLNSLSTPSSLPRTTLLAQWLRRPPRERQTLVRFPLSPWISFQVESSSRFCPSTAGCSRPSVSSIVVCLLLSCFTFHLGFVHPLQDVALHQCLPLSSVCCFPVSPFT